MYIGAKMNKNEQKRFLKNAISCALATAFLGTSVNVFAQQAKPSVPSPADMAQKTQPVASNPFGAVPPTDSAGINYGTGVNNINGQKKVNVPANLVDPALAQQQMMGAPTMPPSGLPAGASFGAPVDNSPAIRRGDGNDAAERSLNVINSSDERIRELNREFYKKSRVINEGPVTAPKANNGVITAHVSPGSTSPVVRLFKNRTSTIVITDMSGQPWPIANYDGLSDEDFTVKRLDNPAPDGYVLSITPKGAFVSGNLVLSLKGLVTPLNIEFVSAQKDVDVSTEIRVQAKGPNTQFTNIGLPTSVDTALLSVLQGVAPVGAKELKVSSNAVQAWLAKDGSMYVRTRYKIMSPAFDNVTSSPDGTYAYKMIPVAVVLFKVEDGRFGEFTVDGF
jgi:intracellular multiplication protein IcmK